MASNSLPSNTGQLIGLATKINQGLTSLGTTLKITQITPAEFTAMLNASSRRTAISTRPVARA